jgi:hypothetical protein
MILKYISSVENLQVTSNKRLIESAPLRTLVEFPPLRMLAHASPKRKVLEQTRK